MEKTDLLVFGDISIDHFYEVDRIPRLNNASDVIKFRQFYGGMGANTAVVSRALGLKTGLVSVIGTDAEDYRKYMQNFGITLFLKGIFGDTTKSLFFKQNGEQISFFYKGVSERLDDLDVEKDLGINKDVIKDVDCVFMARTYLKLQRKVAGMCRNKFLVYNPGYGVFKFKDIPEKFYRILKNANVLVLNHHELQHLKKLGFNIRSTPGPKVFLITRSDRGCNIYSKGAEVNVSSFKTNVIDSSGAGDAFNAGFIAGQLRNFDVYDSVKMGNAAASFIVEKWGCQTNLPTWEMAMDRYGGI
ncbi:MAG: PfkB family carbohydrate kinase [Candidatus Altiarchaeota archaeon]|nr:PfkB family carbohydrate kinase [Candidatus Altiarchaeota archaeon]